MINRSISKFVYWTIFALKPVRNLNIYISLCRQIVFFYVEKAKIFMLIFNVILHEIFQNLFFNLDSPEFRKYNQFKIYWTRACFYTALDLTTNFYDEADDLILPVQTAGDLVHVVMLKVIIFDISRSWNMKKEPFWPFRPSLYRSYTCFIIQSVKPFLQFWKSFSFCTFIYVAISGKPSWQEQNLKLSS